MIKTMICLGIKDNTNYLHKSVMTGILWNKLSDLYSGANSIIHYGILDNEFKEFFGITEEELEQIYSQIIDTNSDNQDNILLFKR